jgi:hypothetical protein
MVPHPAHVPGRDVRDEPFPDDFPRGFSKITAIGVIYEDVDPVRREPGDKFGLFLDNVPVAFLTQAERLLGLFSGR